MENKLIQRLISARESVGMNRKEFANAIGMSYRTITNYEGGINEPSVSYLAAVAVFCNCSSDWLMGVTDELRRTEPISTKEQHMLDAYDKAPAHLQLAIDLLLEPYDPRWADLYGK